MWATQNHLRFENDRRKAQGLKRGEGRGFAEAVVEGVVGVEEGAEFAAEGYVVGRAAGAAKPRFDFSDIDTVDGGPVPHFNAKLADVEGGFSAPVGFAEAVESEDGSLVEGFGLGDFDEVFDTGFVAEGDLAFTGGWHEGRIAHIFAFCSPL
jgi:hypothetical protein